MSLITSIKILPSLIAADMGHLADACRKAAGCGADGIHLDIMDGHFVPNITIGTDVVRMARDVTPHLYRHVHLMVMYPEEIAPAFMDAGAQTLLFHVEARVEPERLIALIRKRGVAPGLAINPETPAKLLEPYLSLIDEVLVMTVHPGFGGQSFMDGVLPKISEIKSMAPSMPVSIDGGITLATAPRCAARGASILVSGTALYRAPDMAADVHTMREQCRAVFPL